MKTETCKLYSRVFWKFLPNVIKIDLYNFELYRFKVGAFFETECSTYSTLEVSHRGIRVIRGIALYKLTT